MPLTHMSPSLGAEVETQSDCYTTLMTSCSRFTQMNTCVQRITGWLTWRKKHWIDTMWENLESFPATLYHILHIPVSLLSVFQKQSPHKQPTAHTPPNVPHS